MVRALSRGRYEHRSPALESPTTDAYRGGGLDGLRSAKKAGLGISSRADLYSTPPRSPASRTRFGRDRDRDASGLREGAHRERDYGDYGDYDERRDPVSEGRTYGRAAPPGYGRPASALRERSYAGDDDESRHGGMSLASDRSSSHARDVLSKIRARDRGAYADPVGGSRPPLRSRSVGRVVDPHRRGPREEEDVYARPHPSPHRGEIHGHDSSIIPASRYEVLGLKEELKKKEGVAMSLRREMDLKEENLRRETDLKEDSLRREMDAMSQKHEEVMTSERSKLVTTFKEDMHEMKTEWEEAFQRLKDESDASQRALEGELKEATRAKADVEGQMSQLRAAHHAKVEEDKARYREQIAGLKAEHREQTEELKQSKEEDLERLRGMYEEHLDTTKHSAASVEEELREEMQARESELQEEMRARESEMQARESEVQEQMRVEVRTVLEENEKVKMCYQNLEAEASQCKAELDEVNSNYQKAVSDNLRWEKDANSYKEELEDVLDENDKQSRHNKTLEEQLSKVKEEVERMNSQYQRSQAERARFESEYDDATKDRDRISAEYDDLLKKLDDVQEERTLESRYTEALVNQRDNMNAIIENSQAEIDELKGMSAELSATLRQYESLGKEFRLANGDAETLREELTKADALAGLRKEFRLAGGDDAEALREGLARAEAFTNLGREFHIGSGNGDDLPVAVREELVRSAQFVELAKELGLPGPEASAVREELVRTSSALRDEAAKSDKMRGRLETLGRERERYNATVKALKYDLKALHGSNVGSETSLQEHMRLLNARWDANEGRLKQIDKLKGELEDSIKLLEQNAKERENMMKGHGQKLGTVEQELKETQKALIKMERERIALGDQLADRELLDAKKKRNKDELEVKCEKLVDHLNHVENELQDRESQCKSLESDKRSLNAELNKLGAKKSGLEDALDKMEDVKKGLKKKLESAYFDLEETQQELATMRNDHEDEMQSFEAELSKFSTQKDDIATKQEEINSLKDMLNRVQEEQSKNLEEAQDEIAESFKVQLRLLEEKHTNQEREMERELRAQSNEMERAMKEMERAVKEKERVMKEQKESLDQKSMVEIKRRGEFAKQKQELEILRSKERHLETHVNQLEEHISKVVSDYEAKLQNSNITMCSGTNNSEEKVMKKQVRELEKKLEVSSAAMKQIGKSSLLMEKENERLKADKNELKLKLKKLVDCAEKFSPKRSDSR